MNNSFIRYKQKQENKKYPDGIKLPRGYKRCEYVTTQKNFGGYIDTGLKADINDEYIVTCRRTPNGNNLPVFGDGKTKQNSNNALWLNDKTNLVEFTFGDGGSNNNKVLTSSYNVCEFHTYRMQNWTRKAWLDGNYIGQSKNTFTIPEPQKLVFMASWRGSTANAFFLGDVKEFIIIRNGVKIRHFIPCVINRNTTNNYAGFYDICGNISDDTGTPFYTAFKGNNRQLHSSPDIPDDDADIQLDIDITEAGATFSLLRFKFSDSLNTGLNIDWGDGNVELTKGETNYEGYSHAYAQPGIYRLKVQRISSLTTFYTNTNASTNSIVNVKRLAFECIKADNHVRLINSHYARISDASIPGNPVAIYNSLFDNCYRNMIRHLPDSIQEIWNSAFYNNTRLKTLKFPSSLTTLYNTAFKLCTSLGKISLPESLTSIGDTVFMQCYNLDLDNFPPNVTSIGIQAFQHCNLSSMTTFSTAVTTIGQSAFESTSINVASMNLPNLTTLGQNAFKSCSSLALTTLNAPNLTSIGNSAFQQCSLLNLASLPASLTSIGSYAFYGCSSLALTTMPDTITSIGNEAFRNCTSLVLTHLSDNLDKIEPNLFKGSPNIALTSLPIGITYIGNYAFEGCNGITDDLVIPSPVKTIVYSPFNHISFNTVRFLGKPDEIGLGGSVKDMYVPWSEGEVDWTNINATRIHYDCDISDYYIQDGLTGWYDGIRNTRNGHDANATSWANLASASGQNDITLHLENCSVESDHLHLNGTGLAGEAGRLGGNSMIIEIVYARAEAKKGVIVYGYNGNHVNPLIYTDSNGKLVLSSEYFSTQPCFECTNGIKAHYAKNSNYNYSSSVYKNGVQGTDMSTDDTISQIGYARPLKIGDVDTSLFDSCPGNGDIYCIRHYNRKLTNAEIAHNYNIDRMRFKMYLQESSSSSSE